MSPTTRMDAVIIGGGFYGCAIADYLVARRGFKRVVVIEREAALMQRASLNNQARVHNGYHYPRSFTTAFRSRINLPLFVESYSECVHREFENAYAIARHGSKVTARQFMRFCGNIGASLRTPTASFHKLFEPRLVERVFLAEEYTFDSRKLALRMDTALRTSGVQINTGSEVHSIRKIDSGGIEVHACSEGGVQTYQSGLVFNCTYAGVNQFSRQGAGVGARLRHEITEMALIDLPGELADIGVTMMDGPFFSVMPFPSRGLSSLSHVRYTPHLHWVEDGTVNPYIKLAAYKGGSRVDRMLRDSSRYIPRLRASKYRDSLFEVKTVLERNESDDGRPIFFEKSKTIHGAYSVLGGKIDNIFDVYQRLEEESFLDSLVET